MSAEARVKRVVTVQDAQEILRRYGYGYHADALDALIPELPTDEYIVEAEAALERHRRANGPAVTDDANDLAVALRSVLDSMKVSREFSAEDWSAAMDSERQRQIEHGYDDAHDRAHGPAHLLNWAIDYARRGRSLEAATMVREVLRTLSAEPPTDARYTVDGALMDARLHESPPDDEREAIADEISGIQVGSGYESVTIGITAALEAADAIMASPVWRNRHRGPITEAVERAVSATWAPSEYLNREQNDERRSAYAADVRRVLEAAGFTS